MERGAWVTCERCSGSGRVVIYVYPKRKGWTPRFQEEDLKRAFFSARHTRTLDDLGYLVLQRCRLYAEEGLAGMEVAVWVAEDSLTIGYGGEGLSRYEIECDPATGVSSAGRLRKVKSHTLFGTSITVPQLRLFDLGEVLGEEGWVQFLRLDEYAPRQPRRPDEHSKTYSLTRRLSSSPSLYKRGDPGY
ncbi:MAG TPA: hypothetical protein VE525_11505 [Rubrobacter sp.]|nr:hypothetical protein [Rubrobacter sp.]